MHAFASEQATVRVLFLASMFFFSFRPCLRCVCVFWLMDQKQKHVGSHQQYQTQFLALPRTREYTIFFFCFFFLQVRVCLLPSLPSRPSLPPLLSLPSLPSSTFFYLLYLLLSSSTFSIFSTCSTLFNLLIPSSTFSTCSTFPIVSYLLLPHRPSSTFFQPLLSSSIGVYLPYLIYLLYHPYRLHLLYHLVVAPFSIITCTVGVPSSHYYFGSLSRTSRTFYFPDSRDLLDVLGGPLEELQH